MIDKPLVGSCLCGTVTYQVDSPFLQFVHCHCSRCRKATGTAHASNLYVNANSFAWILGGDNLTRYDLPSARSFAAVFCKICGSPLPHHTRSGQFVVIPAGSLDTPLEIKPSARIFWASRAPWENCDDESLPKFPERPEKWP